MTAAESYPAFLAPFAVAPFAYVVGRGVHDISPDRATMPAAARKAAKAALPEARRDGGVDLYFFDDLSWGVAFCSHPGVGDTEFAAVGRPVSDAARVARHCNMVRMGAKARGYTLGLAEIIGWLGTDAHLEHAVSFLWQGSARVFDTTTEQRIEAARSLCLFA